MKGEKVILHIIPAEEWDRVKEQQFYFSDRLKTEGFIRCATREQVLNAVEFIYKEKISLKLLYIDSQRVEAPIVYEDVYKTGEKFPHIYGALNLNAVIKVVDFKPNENGAFELQVLS